MGQFCNNTGQDFKTKWLTVCHSLTLFTYLRDIHLLKLLKVEGLAYLSMQEHISNFPEGLQQLLTRLIAPQELDQKAFELNATQLIETHQILNGEVPRL